VARVAELGRYVATMGRMLVLLGCVLAGCGGTWHPRPTPTPIATLNEPAQSYTSHDGVHFLRGPGPDPRANALRPVGWQHVAFEGGRLTLSNLTNRVWSDVAFCGRVVLVQVGPPQGNFRRVTAWADPHAVAIKACRGAHRAIELSPRGWTQATIAAPSSLDIPDRRLRTHPEGSALAHTAVLQPDRRTIVVGYEYGGCSDLAGASARQDGTRVTVSVRIGVDPDLPDNVACPAMAALGFTFVRLPAPAAPGTTITVARCGLRDPRC
jgi:hypothetical protein